MSPIDDELRTALHRRADAPGLVPADPLAGIERRARGMRRRRAATALTGSALAVALVAVGASTLGGSTLVSAPDDGRFATQAPATDGPTAAPATPGTDPTYVAPPPLSETALDPADPWAYRGEQRVRGNGFEETAAREYAGRHPGYESITPLFGQVYEPSGRAELVFVSSPVGDGGGPARWGVAQVSESGPEFVVDEELPEGGTNALVAVLAGDETARLLVVASPSAERAEYVGGTTPAPMTELSTAPAVFTHPLEGDRAIDLVRVYGPGGSVLYNEPASEPAASGGEAPAGTAAPENALLSWPTRGATDQDLLDAALTAYERGRGQSGTMYHVLFIGSDDAGARYLLAQMWQAGDRLADTVGYVERPGQEPELQAKSRATPDQAVLALLVTATSPGQSTDTLVVVPRPQTGEVLYAATGSDYRPVSTPGLDGAALVDRQQGAAGEGKDMLRLLDGNGRQYFEGPVTNLLCGVSSCS